MLYRVHIDMTKILPLMKEAQVKAHNKVETTVWVRAKDPDEACDLAIRKVCSDIMKERNSTRYKDIAKQAKNKISVVRIRRSNSSA